MATVVFPSLARAYTVPASHHRYTYIFSRPSTSTSTTSTILFLHGFPSSSFDWRHQITFFITNDYGVLAPDLLGYGQNTPASGADANGPAQPTELSDYKAKTMSADIIALLDHENISGPVHAVGHDTGCYLLSRLGNYYPTRLASLSFLEVPYQKPGEGFHLDAINEMVKQVLGFERFGYLKFFVSEGAAGLIEEHVDSFFTLFYPAEADLWIEHLGPTGALETWLRNDRKAPLAPYITEEEKATHFKIMRGHYKSALMWYRALVGNINVDDEIQAQLDSKLYQPVLMLASQPSRLNIPGAAAGMMRQFAQNLTVREVDAKGHWIQLEARDEIGEAVASKLPADAELTRPKQVRYRNLKSLRQRRGGVSHIEETWEG
ncbi:epoxide hydrolase [Histoplasma capsulatum G186AR]|uniref:Epoxide hydrolase n=1 Tax=Ajellomyces capsulatus (strain G186AR / H82 / ATCC MYA-2454 / RMSCC 2432) TaxID=447093 RepID=C0NQC6_AJECG|nr:epoxide hydrolase [Histoplasma capsulatum G186AR]EEH06398.1 epoxide hydrolase [Histoplasma capsulatum G186AR]